MFEASSPLHDCSAALAQVNARFTVFINPEILASSGLWALANISFARHACAKQSERFMGERWLFIFGLPGTIVTFIAVAEGSERAYGIDLPRRGRP